MFRINMYKVYVGLIAIILLTSQAQATRLFSYFFCCNKKEPIHDMKSLIIDQSLLRQVPQKAKLPKERVVEKLTLPELFIAPTGETLKLLDEIQKRDNYKLVPICAQQFALKRSVMAFKEFNDQIDRKILKYQFNRMNEHGRAILHGTQALVGHRAVVLKFEQMMGQKSQPEPQSTQQVMQQSIEQLIPEVNGLLDRLHGLYKKCSDSDTYLHDDDNELNKILDELICIFTTAKQQNHIFSTSNLRVFVEKLNELAYFNFCYDLQKVTTLYAAIVQHIKPYYSVKHAEKLVAYNDRTKNPEDIIEMIIASQIEDRKDEDYHDHADLISYLAAQMEAFAEALSDDGKSGELSKEEIQTSIVGFQILGELASKTDGIWSSSNTEERVPINLHKMSDILWKLMDKRSLTNQAYALALVSALERVTAAAIPEREESSKLSALISASRLLDIITDEICTTKDEQVQSLLSPTMFRAYAHINAKIYFTYNTDSCTKTLESASKRILSLAKQIKKDQLPAIKEAMHCMIVMSNNMFKFRSNHLDNMCSVLQHLIQINSMTHATALQIMRVYELATAGQQLGLFYFVQVNNILKVLQAIGEHSTDRTILNNAICMLRRINIFLDQRNARHFIKETTRVLSLVSKQYVSLCTPGPGLKNRHIFEDAYSCKDFVENMSLGELYNDDYLQKAFGTVQKLIKPEQFCTLIEVSQFLDTQNIDPFYINQLAQFMENESPKRLATTVLNSCFQQLQYQQVDFAGKIPERHKIQVQQFGTM